MFQFRVPHYKISTDYHFRTRLSQSPMTATQMSLSPVSLRRWNQIGNQQKKVVCRSATVDARLNKPSYLLYLVCRWTDSSTPQLWRRSMISRPRSLPEDDALNLGCFLIFVRLLGCCQALSGSPLWSVSACDPNWTLLKASKFVCLWDSADGFLNLYTPVAPSTKIHHYRNQLPPLWQITDF